jgi:hypothetical protein
MLVTLATASGRNSPWLKQGIITDILQDLLIRQTISLPLLANQRCDQWFHWDP